MNPTKRYSRGVLGVVAALSLTVAGCGGGTAPAASAPGGTASSPGASGTTGWSQDHAGTSLTVLGEATLNSQVLEGLLPDFKEKTGIDVVIEQAPYDSVVQKATLDAQTNQGAYDVISLPYEFLGAFAEQDWIAPIDDRLSDTSSFVPRLRPRGDHPRLVDGLLSLARRHLWRTVEQRRDDDVLSQGSFRERR